MSNNNRELLRQVLEKSPDYIEALAIMADMCTRSGAFEEGFAIDKHLAFLQPFDPCHYYNLACDCALLGNKEEALLYLKIAIMLGYNDFKHITEDPDLESLKGDKRYENLIRENFPGTVK